MFPFIYKNFCGRKHFQPGLLKVFIWRDSALSTGSKNVCCVCKPSNKLLLSRTFSTVNQKLQKSSKSVVLTLKARNGRVDRAEIWWRYMGETPECTGKKFFSIRQQIKILNAFFRERGISVTSLLAKMDLGSKIIRVWQNRNFFLWGAK